MDIQLHEDADSGYSPDGFGSRNSASPLRFRLSQPGNDADGPSTEALLVRELLQHIHDLRVRVENLEDRVSSPRHDGQSFGAEAEPEPTQDECDDLNKVAVAEPSLSGQQAGGLRLDDLPRGPLSINVVAATLGRTVRTIRGWCPAEKYGIPCHKEGGRWHFYRDELVAWYEDYERVSRRDAKRSQAKRRRTKNGKQGL